MPKLSWIGDDSLYPLIERLLQTAKKAKEKSRKEFGKNVIDPFSAVFEMSGFEMTFDEWILSEQARQAQKTLQNSIGEFHQGILGSCIGWTDMGKGKIVDLLNEEKKIVAEVKNKFNTISGGKLSDLYWSLEEAVMNKTSIYKGFTAYHVAIIPDTPEKYNNEFTPSDKAKGQKCPPNPLIRTIDGASFYELVTGVEGALGQLFDVIPVIVQEMTNKVLESQKLKEVFNAAYAKKV